MSLIFVFCTKTDRGTNGIAVCTVRLGQFLLTEAKFLCTSEEEGDFYFESFNRRYCKHCIRHYLRKLAEFDPFTIFNDRLFVFFY